MAKKVAREIKYFSPNTDYDALTSELSAEKDLGNDLLTAPKSVDSASELEEYLEWAKQTADKSTNKKVSQNE
jgi:hypothetical protein